MWDWKGAEECIGVEGSSSLTQIHTAAVVGEKKISSPLGSFKGRKEGRRGGGTGMKGDKRG